MGGPVALALLIATVVVAVLTAFYDWPRWPTAIVGLFTLAWVAFSLPLAAFQVHRDQNNELVVARTQLQAAQADKSPKLIIKIDAVTTHSVNLLLSPLMWFEKETMILVRISVANDGADSVARDWKLSIEQDGNHATAKNVRLRPRQHILEVLNLNWAAIQLHRVDTYYHYPNQLISEVTSVPISRGHVKEGFIIAKVPQQFNCSATVHVTCSDFRGQTYAATSDGVTSNVGCLSIEESTNPS